jgi:hypothetical protein
VRASDGEMKGRMSSPILVTGSHRSGTTWVGRMLELSRQVGYIHEPMNPQYRPGWLSRSPPYSYYYICHENEAGFVNQWADVLRYGLPLPQIREIRSPHDTSRLARNWLLALRYRARNLRPLVKDPIALFSAAWLYERYGFEVVVMVRHPAAFVSSLKRLAWRFDFNELLKQDLFMRDVAGPFAPEIESYARAPADLIPAGSLVWNLVYSTVDRYRTRFPDWTYIRHEDLAADPAGRFEAIYRRLGLSWTSEVSRGIQTHSGSQNPRETERADAVARNSRGVLTVWRERLSAAEIEEVLGRTRDVATRFYTPEELDGP